MYLIIIYNERITLLRFASVLRAIFSKVMYYHRHIRLQPWLHKKPTLLFFCDDWKQRYFCYIYITKETNCFSSSFMFTVVIFHIMIFKLTEGVRRRLF